MLLTYWKYACTCLFEAKNTFLTKLQLHQTEKIIRVLANHLLQLFLSYQFEILHSRYSFTEDMLVFFKMGKNVPKLQPFQTQKFSAMPKTGWQEYNQLLPQFISNQLETLHGCCRHTEDVHLLFLKRKNIFDRIMTVAIFEIWGALTNTGWQAYIINPAKIVRYRQYKLATRL